MRLIPRTILGQLVAGTVIVQTLVFSAFLAIGIRKAFNDARERSQQRLHEQAEVISKLTAEAVASGDTGEVSAVLHSVGITTILKGLRITDMSGNTLRVSSAHVQPQLSPAEIAAVPKLQTSGNYVRLEPPAVQVAAQTFAIGGKPAGIVWIYPDFVVTARNSWTVLQYALIYGLCALIGNLLLVLVLSRSIAEPLRRLRRASLGVVHNPENLSAFPLAVLSRNEAGELTESVNTMVAEIAVQRKGTQETLSLLDSMLLNAPVGFAFFDPQLRYVRINRHLEEINGLPESAHVGKTIGQVMLAPEAQSLVQHVETQVSYVFRTGKPVQDYEISAVMPSEPVRKRAFICNFYPIQTAAGEPRWVGVAVSEITERLRNEEAMRRSEKLAAAGRLAASIAHEINNPLESVTNLLYLIQNHTDLDSTAKTYADMAQTELMRVSEITQQTLRFYRQSTLPMDVRMDEVLRSVLVLHQGRLQASNIAVVRKTDEHAVLFAFSGELRQLFTNLVGNAIDAMPRGGRLLVRTRAGRRGNSRGVWITVADTGSGMPESVRRHIFEPFFTTKEATGTGLGLWVSQEILQKHTGTIQVRSRVSTGASAASAGAFAASGTVFRVFFPADGVPRGPVIVRPTRQMVPQAV